MQGKQIKHNIDNNIIIDYFFIFYYVYIIVSRTTFIKIYIIKYKIEINIIIIMQLIKLAKLAKLAKWRSYININT
jgi:hypothetical protein